MQFKVYRGSAGVVFFLLSILALIFFMLPAILVFIAIGVTVSILGSLLSAILSNKKIPSIAHIQKNNKTNKVIDITADVE